MFKMLSFGLDAGFESFPPLVNGLIHNLLACICCHGNRAAGTRVLDPY